MRGLPSRYRVRIAGALAALALLATAASSPAGGPALEAAARVRITVEVARPVNGLTADELRARLAGALQRAAPPVVDDADAPDRLRLRVALEPRSATALRGFWLPFSGTYAIGLVGLALERPVIVPAPDRLTTAIVWRQDRVVAVPWRAAPAEVRRAADAVLEAWLAARAGP